MIGVAARPGYRRRAGRERLYAILVGCLLAGGVLFGPRPLPERRGTVKEGARRTAELEPWPGLGVAGRAAWFQPPAPGAPLTLRLTDTGLILPRESVPLPFHGVPPREPEPAPRLPCARWRRRRLSS